MAGSMSMPSYNIWLIIYDIAFVKNTITKEWYDGHFPVDFLYISSPTLEFIAENCKTVSFVNVRQKYR